MLAGPKRKGARMFRRDRPDGTRVTKAPKVRLFMPHLMPRRSEAVVYFEHRIDLSGTYDYLDRWNADPSRPKLTLFHVFNAALAFTLHERPRLNRFIAGRRLYQRNAIDIAISVIKAKNDDAKLTVVKKRFDATDGLLGIRDRIEDVVANGRDPAETASEKEVSLLSLLPRSLIPFFVKLQKVGDYFNILPASLIANDPLYSSAMVSNLGSIGIDSAFHHLYEHGTLPIFATLGRAGPEVVVNEAGDPVVRPCMTARYSFDERISDGYYAARGLDLLQELVQRPWMMEREGDNGPGPL